VTYVNYPTTEYLQLPFLDFVCFNVFLERPDALQRYLARLQNIAGDRPLVLAEIGLDSARNGEAAQAEAIDWQVRGCFRAGCAGTFVFSWTDEWHRGGHDVDDWSFGLVTREREPKPALATVRRAYAETPMAPDAPTPRISVVICTYNGSRTLRAACEAVARLDYPDVETILVDDGSTDGSADIGREHGFRVISTQNRGLAAARNTGIAAASGEIVAFLDDDAAPDRDWLTFLADAFATQEFVGVGGPNIPVPGDGPVADAVAASPGGPTHVLVSDREAEHIPGCNMAFRRAGLLAIGGFDERFRTAGDDVDLCWRLLARGGRLGFAPGAMVWHHRRATVGGYLRQQRSYGVAEGMLEEKWPERYTAGGHVTWRGRMYGNDLAHSARRLRWRVYYGQWGTNLFQPLYQPNHYGIDIIALLPEIYLVVALLLLLSALGAVWTPLLLAAPLAAAIVVLLSVRALGVASAAIFPTSPLSPGERSARLLLTTGLQLVQPLVRLQGRLSRGLTLWRRRGVRGLAFPRGHRLSVWSEGPWRPLEDWLQELEEALAGHGAVVRRGGTFDAWDFEVRGGTLAGARVLGTVEEHGEGRQQLRFACRTRWSRPGLFALVALATLAGAAAAAGAALTAAVLGTLAIALATRTVVEASGATSVVLHGIRAVDPFAREDDDG
jgi:GT2 family glycosyltransferase